MARCRARAMSSSNWRWAEMPALAWPIPLSFGRPIAASRPIMASTTRSSSNVKASRPRRNEFWLVTPLRIKQLLPAEDVVLVDIGVGCLGGVGLFVRSHGPNHDVATQRKIVAGTSGINVVIEAEKPDRTVGFGLGDSLFGINRIQTLAVVAEVERDDVRSAPGVAELPVNG